MYVDYSNKSIVNILSSREKSYTIVQTRKLTLQTDHQKSYGTEPPYVDVHVVWHEGFYLEVLCRVEYVFILNTETNIQFCKIQVFRSNLIYGTRLEELVKRDTKFLTRDLNLFNWNTQP